MIFVVLLGHCVVRYVAYREKWSNIYKVQWLGQYNMKNKLLTIIPLVLLNGCADPFFVEIDKMGYTAFTPPRTNAKVGSVFSFQKNSSGKLTVRQVCHYLYDDLTVTTTDLTLADNASSDTVDANLAASLVKDLVSNPPKLETGFRSAKEVNIKFGKARSHYITDQDLINLDGQPLPMAPSCYAALKKYSKDGELSKIFFIVDVITVNSMTYTVEKTSNSNLDVNFDIKKVVEIKPNISFESNDNYSMIIDEERSIAYKAFSITSFTPSGLTGPTSAYVSIKPLTKNDIDSLGDTL